MTDSLNLMATALVSLVLSLAVLRALTPALSRVLALVCPNADAAAFWLRYAQIMLALAPLLVALGLDLFGRERMLVDTLRLAFMASGAGLLLGLAAIGRRLRPFIVLPRAGSRP